MHAISATYAIQLATQITSVILAGLGLRAARKWWKDDNKLDRFGRWHTGPLARVYDAFTWGVKQAKAGRLGRTINAFIVHLGLTALFPVLAVLVSNATAVKDHPVAFGLAGVVAGVLAEGPEAYARNAQYAEVNPLDAEPSVKVDPTLRGKQRFKSLHPDQKVAAIAVPVAFGELALGIALYYAVYKAGFVNHMLDAVVLGIAFVVWAEAMSVLSTMWLVGRRGSPFRTA